MAQNFFDKVTTAVAGATYTAFSDRPCDFVRVHNANSVNIEVRKDGAGNTIIVPPLATRTVTGLQNASQVSVRRQDTSATQVDVSAEVVSL